MTGQEVTARMIYDVLIEITERLMDIERMFDEMLRDSVPRPDATDLSRALEDFKKAVGYG